MSRCWGCCQENCRFKDCDCSCHADERKEVKDPPKERIRYVEVRGVRYLRAEDVAEYIREIAGSEEVDTRNRLNEAAESLTK